MKKAILLIAALLMVGSLAFADIGFGMWGRTVFQLAGGATGSSVITQGWGPNWGGNGPRMGLDLNASGEKMDYKISFQFNGDAVNYPNIYGTVKFIPDLLSVLVGKISGDGWDTFRQTSPNPNSDVNNDNIGRMDGWGIIIAVSPKDSGFDAALQWKTPAPTGSQTEFNIEDQIYNINAAAAYAIANIVKISAGWQSTPGTVNPTNTSNYNLWVRAELLAVENLTLWVDGRFYGFGTVTALSMKYVLGAGYKMDTFAIYLGAFFAVPANSTALAMGANLEAIVDLGDISVGGIVKFGIPDFSVTGMTIDVQPYVQLDDFGTRIAFEFGYNTAGAGSYTWAVPVYFTFSF